MLPLDESKPKHEPLNFELNLSTQPDRLDKTLAALLPQYSRNRIQQWIQEGAVLVNQNPAKIKQTVGPGDLIQVWPQALPEEQAFEPQNLPLNIIAENEHWLVVNKPAGLVTHPGAGNWSGTLLNALLYHYPELKTVPRAGIVHRLDKETSGVLVIARSDIAQTSFVRQLQSRSMGRSYQALVKHHPALKQGTIDLAIGRDPRVPVKMSVDEHAVAPKQARTHYEVIKCGYWQEQAIALLHCELESGRTHQIRVHLSALKHPILVDSLYGGPQWTQAERHLLHAWQLSFTDPISDQIQKFEAPLADDFAQAIQDSEWLD